MIPDRMKRSTSKGEEFLAVGGSDGTTLAGDATVLALIDTLAKLVNVLISNTSTTDATGRQRIILESDAGTFAAGACGAYHPSGPTGTASAGTAATLTTTTTINRDLSGFKVRITAGTGAGQEATILSNTYGANSVLTFATLGTVPDNTSQ